MANLFQTLQPVLTRVTRYASKPWEQCWLCRPRSHHRHNSNTVISSYRHADGGTYEYMAQHGSRLWPRIPDQPKAMDIKLFHRLYGGDKPWPIEEQTLTFRGRIMNIRKMGSRIAFVDLTQDGHSIQIMLDEGKMLHEKSQADFRDTIKALRRSDFITISGYAAHTKSGHLTVFARTLPILLSSTFKSYPIGRPNEDTLSNNRQLDLMFNPRAMQILKLRSHIMTFLHIYFSTEGFHNVQTPIIGDRAGGAVAAPFKTTSSQFGDRKLALRIAPELWLKRLIIGGMHKVYEIGPCFRNEGIDLTHNPEFWTCEYYEAYANLNSLLHRTETMLQRLARHTQRLFEKELTALSSAPCRVLVDEPFQKIDFIQGIEKGLGHPLPKLHLPKQAREALIKIFILQAIDLPRPATLPRLLDKLCSKYLLPQCQTPTWIMYHPECMSPLAKSFTHPQTNQRVAAGAELYLGGQELINTYEEENSPVEQLRKFKDQLEFQRHAVTKTEADLMEKEIDHGYVDALTWGLPPTGGWGCGIDRLCMFLAGSERIAETMSFGSLQNVIAKRKVDISGLSAETTPEPSMPTEEDQQNEIDELEDILIEDLSKI